MLICEYSATFIYVFAIFRYFWLIFSEIQYLNRI